jgi:hypothetical protein
VYTATVVLACVLLVAVSTVLIARAFHRPSNPGSPAASASPAVARAELQAATDEVDAATTTAVAGIMSLPVAPTRGQVAAVVNPYVETLALYDTVLSGSLSAHDLAASSTGPARATAAQIRRIVSSLRTVDVLPPIALGAFVQSFGSDATGLQATLNDLEGALASPSAS